MFGARVLSKGTPPYNFPKTKLKNVTCVHCKHQFIVRELLHMRGQQVPLLLECGHSVCYGCAKLHPNKQCPLCELPVQVDENITKLYPLHIYTLGLAVIANNRPIHGEEPDVSFYQTMPSKLRQIQTQGICYECEIEATLRCPQCNALYCQACYSKIHGKALQKHMKLPLSEIVKDAPLVITTVCSDVCNEPLGYYCKDCKRSSCSHCMLRFHSKHDHITLQERNEELMPSFGEAYDTVDTTLHYVVHSHKKLKTIQMSPTEMRSHETVEALITQHFAHLHGILQNIEKKMIDQIYERRCHFNKNLMDIESQLTTQEERLRTALGGALNAKEIIDKIDMQDIVNQLYEISDVSCHLAQEKPATDEKTHFEADRSIIDGLERHCKLYMPPISEYTLLKTKMLPENYQLEPLTREISIPTSSSYASNELLSSLKKSASTVSLSSSKLEVTFQTDSELVKVMNVVDPSCFYVQFWSNQKQAEELSNSLQAHSANASIPSKEITVGAMYVVNYARENIWRRGRVTRVNSSSDNANITYDVFYVDSGYFEHNIPITRFRTIAPQIAAIPILAMKCCLHDVVPNGDHWSRAAIAEFRRLAEIHVPVTIHIFISQGNTNYVDLCLNPKDAQGDMISMRDTLVLMEHGNFVSLHKLMRTNPLSVPKFFQEELQMEKWTDVEVQLVESPDFIYVTKTGDNKKYISKLTRDMSMFYGKNASSPTMQCPLEIGIPCALLHTDGSWYRGKITQILETNIVDVFCVDYGYSFTVNTAFLRRLTANYMSCRMQAIRISLKDLQPLPEDKDTWSTRTIEFVRNYLSNLKVRVIAMSKENNVYNVYVYAHGKTNFNTLLVSSNLAKAVGVTSSIIPTNNKYYSKKKKRNAKIDRSLVQSIEDDNKKTSQAQTVELDPFKVCVQVHQVQSPDCIYVSEVSREQANVLLTAKIQEFYTKFHSQEKINWSKDAVCAVYSKKDKSYFRARILKVLTEKEVLVFFYDLAIEEVISVGDIQPLNSTFQQEPAYLFKVKLAGILPCGGSGTWPSSSCQKLNEIITENQNCRFYITKVADTEDNAEIPVQLWIKQSRADGPLSPTKIEISSVNKMLVEAGLALPVKGYNDKTDKILAVEFKRQLQEMQVTSPVNEEFEENIKWFSTSKITSTESLDINSQEEENSSVTNISTVSVPYDLANWEPALPIENDNFIAIPTYLDHDGALYLHPKKTGKAMLSFIESKLNDCYKKVKIKSYDKEWKEGDVCVAQYHGTKKWYRGKVERVLDDNTIEVRFVDYGNIEECTNGSIKKKVILGEVPVQCTKCFIVGLNPNTEDGKWITDDLDKIHALLVEKDCKVTVVERTDTHLLISITLIKPKKCDLISYLTDELGMRLTPNPINLSDSKILNDTDSNNTSTDSPDVVIEQYTKEDKSSSEIYEDSEMMMEDMISLHDIISGSSMLKASKSDTSCEEDCNILSLNNTDTIKKEATYSTPQIMSVENLATYIPLIIPDDIDTFEVDLCYAVVATVHHVQIGENKDLKVLNDYYNQYTLLMEDLQKNAPKQPLIKNIVPNTPCCAKFEDGKWYRCIIQKCKNVKDTNKMIVKLCYVDFGNNEKREVTLDNCELHTLKEEWLSVPTISIKCKLWHVSVPPNVDFLELMMELHKLYLMYNKCTIVKVKERYEDYLEVELYVDGNCKQLLYGHLIKCGLLQMKKTKED